MEKLWETTTAIVLAIAGGLADMLNVSENQKLKWSQIITKVLISGFIGIMALKSARIAGLSGDWIGLVCGAAGWMGIEFMKFIVTAAKNVLSVLTRKDEGKENAS